MSQADRKAFLANRAKFGGVGALTVDPLCKAQAAEELRKLEAEPAPPAQDSQAAQAIEAYGPRKLAKQQVIDGMQRMLAIQPLSVTFVARKAAELANDLRAKMLEKHPEIDVKPPGVELHGEGSKQQVTLCPVLKLVPDWMELRAKLDTWEDTPPNPMGDLKLTSTAFHQEVQKWVDHAEIEELSLKFAAFTPPEDLFKQAERQFEPAIPMDAKHIAMIHEFMVMQLQQLLQGFHQLSLADQTKFSAADVEMISELVVSCAVEIQFGVRSDDVEKSIRTCADELDKMESYAVTAQQLAELMVGLGDAAMASAMPADRDRFVAMLNALAKQSNGARIMMANLHKEVANETKTFGDAYDTMLEFLKENEKQSEADSDLLKAASAPGMLQKLKDQHTNDAEIDRLWTEAGCQVQTMVQKMMMDTTARSQVEPPKRIQKLKAREVASMQEYMVEQLQAFVMVAGQYAATRKTAGMEAMNPQVATMLLQGLSSSAVEKKFGISGEDMTLAGYYYAQDLSKNAKFMQSSQTQQMLLMQVPQLCDAPDRCSII